MPHGHDHDIAIHSENWDMLMYFLETVLVRASCAESSFRAGSTICLPEDVVKIVRRICFRMGRTNQRLLVEADITIPVPEKLIVNIDVGKGAT
jgi:hypothetical protein